MDRDSLKFFTNAEILAARSARNQVAADHPYEFFVEPECNAAVEVVDIATLFLTNRECPFRCLMCDLWRNTLTESVQPGEIPQQIRWAFEQLGSDLNRAREIKLYNSGNFFDRKAIPSADHKAIANLVQRFDNVIVENHPKLCSDACLEFRDLIAPATLEIAMGLEVADDTLLKVLNKEMTLDDFARAANFLHENGIRTRAFILLKPPFVDEQEGIDLALKSIDFAFSVGVSTCAVIPTRTGGTPTQPVGMMDQLLKSGEFTPPLGSSLELVLEEGIKRGQGRVFVDTWDAEQFFSCDSCRSQRIERLHRMNLSQSILPAIHCQACHP